MQGLNKGKRKSSLALFQNRSCSELQYISKGKVGSISFMKLVRLSCYCPLYFDRCNACKWLHVSEFLWSKPCKLYSLFPFLLWTFCLQASYKWDRSTKHIKYCCYEESISQYLYLYTYMLLYAKTSITTYYMGSCAKFSNS